MDELSIGVVKAAWSVLIYGTGGIGKSTFAADAPSPLFLQVGEEGSLNLNVARLPLEASWETLVGHVDEIIAGKGVFRGYKVGTLVIDTVDGAEKLAWNCLCRTQKMKGGGTAKSIEDFDYQAGYTMVLELWRALLARLQTCKGMGINIVFISHDKVQKYSNPNGSDYDRIAPDLHKVLFPVLKNWADCTFYAYEEAAVTSTKGSRGKAVASGVRMIGPVDTAAYVAKNRYAIKDAFELDFAEFAKRLPGAETTEEKAAKLIEEIKSLAGKYADVMDKAIAGCKGNPRKLEIALNQLRSKLAKDASEETQGEQQS